MMVHPFHPSLAHIDLPDPTDDGLLQTPKPAFTLKSGDDAGRKFGSPHIASPALAAWTPLVVNHESWQDAGAGGRAG